MSLFILELYQLQEFKFAASNSPNKFYFGSKDVNMLYTEEINILITLTLTHPHPTIIGCINLSSIVMICHCGLVDNTLN